MQLLTIRYYQLKKDLGILFFGVLVGMFVLSFLLFNNDKNIGWYVGLVIFYGFYSFHTNRKDIPFLQKHFENANYQIVFEYQLFLLPISISSLFTPYWYLFFLLHAAILALPFINFSNKYELKLYFLHKWLKTDFIVISGVRKHAIGIALLLPILIILSPVKLFPLIVLFICNMLFFSFYEFNESSQLLKATQLSPKAFLNLKFNTAAKKIAIFNIPVLLINSLFNAEIYMFNLFFLGYVLLMLACTIVFKYASYNPKLSSNNFQIKLILVSLGLYIPYLLPIAIIFYFQSRAEAISNLKHYLDDTN